MRDAGRDDSRAVRHERLVSMIAFAGAAVLFGLVGVGASTTFDYGRMYWLKAMLLGPPVLALPAALAGWDAGPRLAQASDGLGAAIVGVAVTVASALLYVAGAFVVVSAMTLWDGDEAVWPTVSSIVQMLAFGVGYAFVAGLVASPFGALGAVVAWRRIRRRAPADPA